MATLGDRIKMLRDSQGITQQQLAETLGVTDKAVSTWESGRNEPRMGIVDKLAEYFHVSRPYLMGWAEEDTSWSVAFRKNLSLVIQSYAPADIEDAHVDMMRIDSIISGDTILTLDIACAIADEIGEDLDYLLGHDEKPAPDTESGLDAEIIRLLHSLSEGKKSEALHYLRFLAERADKQ